VTTWIVLRAAGIGAYVMLFLSVAFGLSATSAPFDKRFAKASSISVHQFMSTVGLALLSIHIGGLLLDSYMHFGPVQILIPGASSYRPVPVALGVVGMYATVLVLVSSWFRKGYSPKLWRALHMAAVPAFVLSMLHGVFAGADATRRWMFLLYIATACIIVFLLILRGLTVGLRRARRAQSSPPAASRPEVSRAPRSSAGIVDAATGPSSATATDAVAAGASGDRVSVAPGSRSEDRSAIRGGADTRIGIAGSVSRAPATAKAPAINAALSATPTTPHPTAVTPRRNMAAP
jgi:methionine sulfoxide reductase heme-binding subunit